MIDPRSPLETTALLPAPRTALRSGITGFASCAVVALLVAACSTSPEPGVKAASPPAHGNPPAAAPSSAPLRQDEFDIPAATSVEEAAKATQPVDHAQHEMQPMDHSTPPMKQDQPSRTGDPSMTKRSEAKQPRHGHTTASPSKPRQQARDAAKPAASKPQTTAKPQPAAQAVVYTCPMHPEVTSDKPGSCPKCGMTLVKKK